MNKYLVNYWMFGSVMLLGLMEVFWVIMFYIDCIVWGYCCIFLNNNYIVYRY